jgi:hypothetical protein
MTVRRFPAAVSAKSTGQQLAAMYVSLAHVLCHRTEDPAPEIYNIDEPTFDLSAEEHPEDFRQWTDDFRDEDFFGDCISYLQECVIAEYESKCGPIRTSALQEYATAHEYDSRTVINMTEAAWDLYTANVAANATPEWLAATVRPYTPGMYKPANLALLTLGAPAVI